MPCPYQCIKNGLYEAWLHRVGVGVFIWNDQILWIPGFKFSLSGTTLGSYLVRKNGIKKGPPQNPPNTLKWFLL